MYELPRLKGMIKPALPFVLLWVLMGALVVAGGASRAQVSGQVVVRIVAWLLLIVAALFGDRPKMDEMRPVVWLLGAGVLLVLLQLVPLPPALWQALPGHGPMAASLTAATAGNAWRPLALSPGAAMNALSSLVVPATTLWLVAGLSTERRAQLLPLLLAVVVASTMAGLLQFSTGRIDNPLVNETVGVASGTFANRNHFALLLAVGCLLASAWAFTQARPEAWRSVTATGLVLLFLLMILSTGSRAGALLGALALGLALVLSHRAITAGLGSRARWIPLASIVGVLGLVCIFVLISVAADRALSIDRIFAADPGQDMRGRGLPTVLAMVREYFPWGSGLGGFDPVFRMHEPFHLLKPTYFNHAHNDFLEIVLDAGLPGLLLLLAALSWWAWASVRAWRGDAVLPRLGSAILLLVILASLVDYPARTPLIMAVMVIAAAWLSGSARAPAPSAAPLPSRSHSSIE